jgi:hypothetical protein
MRKEVADFVTGYRDCQRAKPAPDTRLGLHASQVVTRPMERIFIDFVGLIVRSRKGNVAILVVLDGFSKFISMYPVRRISAEAVKFVLWNDFCVLWRPSGDCVGQCRCVQIQDLL